MSEGDRRADMVHGGLGLSVRYDFVAKVEGTDLSGFGARAAVKLF